MRLLGASASFAMCVKYLQLLKLDSDHLSGKEVVFEK